MQQQQQQLLLMQQQQQSQKQTTSASETTTATTTPVQSAPHTPAVASIPEVAAGVDKSDDVKYLQFCTDLANADKKDVGKLDKKFGLPISQPPNYTMTDCKCLVRTLVCTIKSVTIACIRLKVSGG